MRWLTLAALARVLHCHRGQQRRRPKMKPLYEQRAVIETKARKLAWSGRHRSYASIRSELQSQGYEGVVKLFANEWTRSELDRICGQAQARQPVRLVH